MFKNSANLTVVYFIKFLEKLNLPNTLWVSADILVTPSTEKSNGASGKLKMIKITFKHSLIVHKLIGKSRQP